MQEFKRELAKEAQKLVKNELSYKNKILNEIQNHAINQIREGYTSFRITNLKKQDEEYLKEWADMSDATVKVIKFKCYENARKYLIKQFDIDLSYCVGVKCPKEGKTLKMSE